MKLSSASLVVTALAAIAGSAIAAPSPLHARTLEAINSFGERDVDVNDRLALLERELSDSDFVNLFARGRKKNTAHSKNAARKARLQRATAAVNRDAAAPRRRGVPLHEGVATASEAARSAVKTWEEAATKAGRAYITSGDPAFKKSFRTWLRQSLVCADDEKTHQKTVESINRNASKAEKERIRNTWPQVWEKAQESEKNAKEEMKILDARLKATGHWHSEVHFELSKGRPVTGPSMR